MSLTPHFGFGTEPNGPRRSRSKPPNLQSSDHLELGETRTNNLLWLTLLDVFALLPGNSDRASWKSSSLP